MKISLSVGQAVSWQPAGFDQPLSGTVRTIYPKTVDVEANGQLYSVPIKHLIEEKCPKCSHFSPIRNKCLKFAIDFKEEKGFVDDCSQFSDRPANWVDSPIQFYPWYQEFCDLKGQYPGYLLVIQSPDKKARKNKFRVYGERDCLFAESKLKGKAKRMIAVSFCGEQEYVVEFSQAEKEGLADEILEITPEIWALKLDSDSWNPNNFGDLHHKTDSDGQGLLLETVETEPPEPDDFQDLAEFEKAWLGWEQSQPPPSPVLSEEERHGQSQIENQESDQEPLPDTGSTEAAPTQNVDSHQHTDESVSPAPALDDLLKSELRYLEISEIVTDAATQQRVKINLSHVTALVEQLEEGKELDPLTVFFDGCSYYLADGYHRLQAYKRANQSEAIAVNLYRGNRRDAILYSVGANADHRPCLARTREDKRKAVETLLADPEWSQWSDRAIAAACKVSDFLVRSIRKAICEKSQIEVPTVKKVRRGDSVYEMEKSGGTKQPEPTLFSEEAPLPLPSPAQKVPQIEIKTKEILIGFVSNLDQFSEDQLQAALTAIKEELQCRRLAIAS